jgi:hypothetical protein
MKEVAKNNLRALGFGKEVEKVEKGECPFCGSTKTKKEDFTDPESYTEFQTSGICQECQYNIFVD